MNFQNACVLTDESVKLNIKTLSSQCDCACDAHDMNTPHDQKSMKRMANDKCDCDCACALP